METLEQILKMWNVDAEMDRTEPSRELLNIPKHHSKYLTILSKHKMAAKKAHFDYLRMRKIKWEYFTGKMSEEELEEQGWEPFQFALKSDVATYMEADKDLIKLLEKKVYHEEVVSVVEAIMQELKQRTWQLRDFISWEKFVAGQ
jgi:Recombination, repair and ssDNA binding protein UvsY